VNGHLTLAHAMIRAESTEAGSSKNSRGIRIRGADLVFGLACPREIVLHARQTSVRAVAPVPVAADLPDHCFAVAMAPPVMSGNGAKVPQ